MKLGTALTLLVMTLGCTGLFARYLNHRYVDQPARVSEMPVVNEMRGDAVPADAAEQLAMQLAFTGAPARGQGAVPRSDRGSQ